MATQANEVVAQAPAKVRGARKPAKAVTAPKGPTIKLTDKKPEYKDGSARALWYSAVRKFNGKTPEEFVESATKTPPARTKDGKGEPPAGWLRYFVKQGLVQLG
jgi:hypothetical protein